MNREPKELDPITLELMQLSFVNIVREMRGTLMRTSYSPILYETQDFSCGLLDAKGQLIGLSSDNPRHIFPIYFQCGATLRKFGKDVYPGDIFMMNDPYTGGTHLNDLAVLCPFFFNGKFSAISAVRAHFTDVGGATPGSLSGKATSIHQEGIRIPPVKICERGKMDNGLMEVLFSNMRLARDREGDFLSMLNTCRTAEVRLNELWGKYGAEVIEKYIDAILDRSEKYMRKVISQIPDGVWFYEDYLESSGTSVEPVPLNAKMEIKEDTISFDFTGTAPQMRGPVNVGLAMAPAGVFIAIKSLLDPLSPVNSGSFRPIKFINPEGTILNARYDAPAGGFSEVARKVTFSAMALISQAIPQAATGASHMGANHTMIGAYDPIKKKDFIFYEYPGGGWGGTIDTDGPHCATSFDNSDTPSFHPAETLENNEGMRVISLELRINGEGAGYHRGGLGMVRRVEVLGERALLSIIGENAIIPTYGVSGGLSGARMEWTIIRKGENVAAFDTPGKVAGFPLEYGDVLEMKSVGGGGYGDPLTRDVELVKQNVLDEYITLERARETYGVVMENCQVDLIKTEELRTQLKRKRIFIKVIASTEDHKDMIGCRLCLLSGQIANQLRVTNGDLMEYVAKEGAPLRAWVKVAPDLTGEESPLGPTGRTILKVQEGDMVQIRVLGGLRRKLD
jgi:N-methylhydantoinase B